MVPNGGHLLLSIWKDGLVNNVAKGTDRKLWVALFILIVYARLSLELYWMGFCIRYSTATSKWFVVIDVNLCMHNVPTATCRKDFIGLPGKGFWERIKFELSSKYNWLNGKFSETETFWYCWSVHLWNVFTYFNTSVKFDNHGQSKFH